MHDPWSIARECFPAIYEKSKISRFLKIYIFLSIPLRNFMKFQFFDFFSSETAENTSESIHSTIYRVKSRVESVFVGYKALEREFDLENVEFTSILRSCATLDFGLFHIDVMFYRGKVV